MAKSKNEIGNKYHYLTVIDDAGADSSGHKQWKCQCDCGNILVVRGSRLRNGEKQSCGCVNRKGGFVDETGKRYGKLTVLARDFSIQQTDRHAYWKCQCDCGKIVSVNSNNLRRGISQSCGCQIGQTTKERATINEVGNRYGKLLVLRLDTDAKKSGGAKWICRCDCGNIVSVLGKTLRQGQTLSCGCIKSLGEAKIQKWLEEKALSFKKEYYFSDLQTENKGYPRFDFAIFNNNNLYCLIEFQGEQHIIDKGDFGKQQREVTDSLKKQYCKEHNIVLYEIFYYDNIEESLQQILQPLCEHK